MTTINGLTGFLPRPERVREVVAPPYDVIKPGTPLEILLKARGGNLWHVTLGPDPLSALAELTASTLTPLTTPSFLVYEQTWTTAQGPQRRIGVFTATQVTDYARGEVIRHEKTFDDKVQGRLALTRQTGLTLEPVFLLTRAAITPVLDRVAASRSPDYDLTPDFAGLNDLHGLRSRIWLVAEDSTDGRELRALVATQPLYIADGHHRYHAALKNGQSHCLAYVVERASIQAYNRVITGVKRFAEVKAQLALTPATWATPAKGHVRILHQGQAWDYAFRTIPQDVVGSLDCSCLERELYPLLGLTHAMIKDHAHFDYYAEWELPKMAEVVGRGDYDLAVALHPVSIGELMAVADAGRRDSAIVMPEKSTFFAPKILSGLVLYKHRPA
jgi:uncharacterized protein (DUF1015 family)